MLSGLFECLRQDLKHKVSEDKLLKSLIGITPSEGCYAWRPPHLEMSKFQLYTTLFTDQ